MTLLTVSCQQKHFGYLSKVKVKPKPAYIASPQKSLAVGMKNTRKGLETATIVYPLNLSMHTLAAKERNRVQTELTHNKPSSKLHAEIESNIISNIQVPKDPWPKPNRTRDNVDSKTAILLTFFHFISIFPVIEFPLGGSISDDWESIVFVLLTTGFSAIIMIYGIKGLYNFNSDQKRKGFLASCIAIMYATIFLFLFVFALLMLYYDEW